MRSITTAATMKEITTEMKVTAAIKKREEWMSDGNKWDTITPGRVPPTGIKYMVVDLETHDWLPPPDQNKYDTGRIVEIAWKLFSGDTGDCLESKQYLIKPYGTYKEIARKATAVHGITTEQASKHGVDVDLVLDELIGIVKNIPNDGFVVAHKMEHEHTVLTNSFSPNQQIVWNDAPKCDTWNVRLLKFLPEEAKDKYKNRLSHTPIRCGLGLQQLHECVCADGMYDYAHFADTDVQMTWEIFRYYKQYATVEELTWTNPSVEEGMANDTKEPAHASKKARAPDLKYQSPFPMNLNRPFISASRAQTLRKKWQSDNQWDKYTKGRDLPSSYKYVAVHTKSHQWLSSLPNEHDRPSGCIVEISWMLFDDEENCIESKQYLLKPHGYDEINQMATRESHGITTELVNKHGSNANSVLSEFITILQKLPQDGFIIAHGMKRENIIFENSLNSEQLVVWKAASKCDTYEDSLVKYLPDDIKKKNTKHLQNMKFGLHISKLHGFIGGDQEVSIDVYIAYACVQMTWDIFSYYKLHASDAELRWQQYKPRPRHMLPSSEGARLCAKRMKYGL